MKNFSRQSGFLWLAPVMSALAGILGSIASFIASVSAALLAIATLRFAVIAVYLLTIVALYNGISACLSFMKSNSPSVPHEVSIAASWVLPSNTGTFLACVGTILFLEFAFRHKNYIANVLGGTS